MGFARCRTCACHGRVPHHACGLSKSHYLAPTKNPIPSPGRKSMVSSTDSIHVAPLHHHPYNSALCQFFRTSASQKGTKSRMSRLFVRDPSPLCKFIMRMLAGLPVMSCFCACSSCTQLHMPLSENNPSKHSGTRIILLSSLCWHYTPMQRDVLSEIQLNRTVHLPVRCSGHIVLDTKD